MALIYQKDTEKTLILSPRESYQRAFDFGTDWTEIRLGMFFGGVTDSGDNTQSTSENVTINNASDQVRFGIKNSTNTSYPGEADTSFLGVSTNNTPGGTANCAGFGYYNVGGSALIGCGILGATVKQPVSANLNAMTFPSNVTGSSAYCGCFVLKIVIANRGASNQQVILSTDDTNVISGSDYSSAALRTLMNSGTFSSPVTIDWNDGAAAYPIPDAFYIRLPFYNNRIRISCMRAIRYA